MIFTEKPKKIRVMFTPFRDGLQSSFGGKVRLADILPAMEFAAKEAGIRHLEFGGGARYQAPYFYVGENPFECMDKMREAVGPDVDLQILTRSVSGVTLTTQRLDALDLQAKLMARHGTTWDRNFDYMNDVDNLEKTGKPIIDSGMHHQVCVALMGLPFKDDTVHTAEFYIDVIKKLLDRGVHIDSVCMKDASGTTDPKTCYDTASRSQEDPPTRGHPVAAHPRHGVDGGVLLHGRNRRRRRRHRPLRPADGIRDRATRCALDVACPQGHRLFARHRPHQDGRDREHAQRGPGGLRLQPGDDDSRCPGRRISRCRAARSARMST